MFFAARVVKEDLCLCSRGLFRVQGVYLFIERKHDRFDLRMYGTKFWPVAPNRLVHTEFNAILPEESPHDANLAIQGRPTSGT